MTEAVDSSLAGRPAGRARPVRTCVGCRERAAVTDLVRVVAIEVEGSWALAIDLRGRLPGRGAHVHPRPECVGQAVRRRAFARALRVPGPVDATALLDHTGQPGEFGSTPSRDASGAPPSQVRSRE